MKIEFQRKNFQSRNYHLKAEFFDEILSRSKPLTKKLKLKINEFLDRFFFLLA